MPEPVGAEIVPGRGAACKLGGREIRAGNAAFLAEAGIEGAESLLEEADAAGATAILVADGQRLAGAILLRDQIRRGVAEALAGLRELGLEDQIILTGDRRRAAEVIAREVGISHVEADLLPAQKLERIQALTTSGPPPGHGGRRCERRSGAGQRDRRHRRLRARATSPPRPPTPSIFPSLSRGCRNSSASAAARSGRPGRTSFCSRRFSTPPQWFWRPPP